MYKHLWKPLGIQNFKKEPEQLMRENVGWEKEIGVPSWTKILKIVGEYSSACSVGALIFTWPSVTDTVVCCWDSLLQDNLPADKLTAQDSELSLLPRTTLGITCLGLSPSMEIALSRGSYLGQGCTLVPVRLTDSVAIHLSSFSLFV